MLCVMYCITYIKYHECNIEFHDRKMFSTRDKPEELSILVETTLRIDVLSDLAAMPLRSAGLFLVCFKATIMKQKGGVIYFYFKTPFPYRANMKKSYHKG